MPKITFDFLQWTSFPSSIKLLNDERSFPTFDVLPSISVTPSTTLRVEAKVKQENILLADWPAHMIIQGSDGRVWRNLNRFPQLYAPIGTYNWTSLSWETTIPSDVIAIRGWIAGGGGTPETPGTTWFDDLRIYMDDVLIYSNDFSNWAPAIIPAEIITGVAAIKFIK